MPYGSGPYGSGPYGVGVSDPSVPALVATTTLQIGRLTLGQPPDYPSEQVGDPIGSQGGSVVQSPRTAPSVSISLATLLNATTTTAQGQAFRRQLRSMLNNTPLKLQGYLYVVYVDDSELNGWYVPPQMSLDQFGTESQGAGLWRTDKAPWSLLGRQRTHYEAREIWMKQLPSGAYARDYLGWIQGTDFATFLANAGALQLSILPAGATNPFNSVSGRNPLPAAMPTGRDGGACGICAGLVDTDVIAYSRAEANLTASDVIVYDRRAVINYAAANSGFEQDTVGNAPMDWVSTGPGWWLSTGATLTAQATANTGSKSMRVITTNAFAFEGAALQLGVLPAGTYNVSAYVKGNAGGEALRLFGGIVSPGTGDGEVNFTATTSFVRQSTTFTSDGSTISWCGIRTPTTSAVTFFVDDVQVTPGTTLQASMNPDSLNPTSYGWEEVYGVDYPWNWLNAGQPADTPVIDNGLTRVRWDNSGTCGLRVDIWNGSTYVEQGKMIFFRQNSAAVLNTWVAASLTEWTPDRAVMQVVLAATGEAAARDRIYVTMQRGELGVTFEHYPALSSAGANVDVQMSWSTAIGPAVTADANASVMKVDSQTFTTVGGTTATPAGSGKQVGTAGTGAGTGNSATFAGGSLTLGNANFTTSENWVALLRCTPAYNVVAPYQVTFTVQQAANAYAVYNSGTSAYGLTANQIGVVSQNTAGYLGVFVGFSATVAQMILEAEAMTAGTGTTTVSSAPETTTASGGSTTQASRTTDANLHVSQATWPNGMLGQFRVFARVKTSASTLNIYAKTSAGQGATVTTTSASYVWVDLGEVTANNTTLEIHMWATAAATTSLDRIEAYLVQDRTRTTAIYSGSRDLGVSTLSDSRQLGAITVR